MCNREELRRLAEAATPGPWVSGDPSFGNGNAQMIVSISDRAMGRDIQGPNLRPALFDAEFIAAANPAAVLGLLDQLDAAEAKLAKANRSLIELKPDPVLVEDSWIPAHELATVCGNFMRSSREFASQIKAAEAKLAAVREIHSSAWWYDEFCDDPSCEQEHVEIDVGDLYHAHPSWLVCECCSGGDLSDTNEPAPWPCPTIRAIDGEADAPGGAA